MAINQEEFDRVLKSFEEVIKDEDPGLVIGVLINALVVESIKYFGDVHSSFYHVSQLQHQYYTSVSEYLREAKKTSPPNEKSDEVKEHDDTTMK